MVEGISDVLDQNGYQLLLVNTANDSSREVAALNLLQQNTVDGVILIATIFTPEHRTVLASLRLPVIILGQEYPGFCSVSHDDRGAAHAATAHMLSKGRTAPGFLGVTMLDKAAGLDRRRGFEDALREAGGAPAPRPHQHCAFNMESGYEQASTLLEREPSLDCLFCATDSIAIGALQYCRSHGIRVPEDLMITAVGDSEAAGWPMSPSPASSSTTGPPGSWPPRCCWNIWPTPTPSRKTGFWTMYCGPGPPPGTPLRRKTLGGITAFF